MAVTSLVVTLSSDDNLRRSALERLAGSPHVWTGTLQGDRLPLVIEADTATEGNALLDWVDGLPGVILTHMVWAAIEG